MFFSHCEELRLWHLLNALLAPVERYEGFFRCWTRKEAYIKAKEPAYRFPSTSLTSPRNRGIQRRCFSLVPTVQKRRIGPYATCRSMMDMLLRCAFVGTNGV
jgi:hypothetical protein